MALSELESIKENSRYLRGSIIEELAESTTKFCKSNVQLLKFHGTYQQDDRDLRAERQKAGLDRHFMFMVRTAVPGGRVTPEQYLAHDRLADEVGNGTLRITSRQGLQLHSVLKKDLKTAIRRINECGLSTRGACGDVVRNIMATPVPLKTPVYEDVQQLALELRQTFSTRTRSYVEVWLDGEKVEEEGPEEVEPIYGKTYLPRKFKFGIAVPPRNDVDIYTNDTGLVPHFPEGEVEGYTFLVGGGMGRTHGREDTYPTLARPLFYVPREKVIPAAVAIVETQRDYGNRENRRRARLRYLLEERGLEWFRSEVESRLDFSPDPPREFSWDTVSDLYGWREQGDGKLFCCVWVQDGRIKDTPAVQYRSAFREIARRFALPVRLTPNCNIIFCEVDPALKPEIDAVLEAHNIPRAETLTEARRLCMACVSMPTCGLGLAESERVFPEVMDEIDSVLRELGLDEEPILIRMTGCPNGCARPYTADISFVGRRPEEYAVFVGGSIRGTSLGTLYRDSVKQNAIVQVVRELLERYKAQRKPGENFSDYWSRSESTMSPACS